MKQLEMISLVVGSIYLEANPQLSFSSFSSKSQSSLESILVNQYKSNPEQTGTYKVISISGNESLYDVTFEEFGRREALVLALDEAEAAETILAAGPLEEVVADEPEEKPALSAKKFFRAPFKKFDNFIKDRH